MTDEASRDEEDSDDANGPEFTHDEEVDTDENSNPAVDADENASERSDPLSDLAETVANGTDRSRSTTSDFDELFDRHDAADIDGDRLWKQLETDHADESETASESGVVDGPVTADESGETDGADDSAEPGNELRPVDREIREVEKRSYCQGCEHFAEPPAVACTRDGSEILAVTSIETFRVADCPFVLEDETLEKRH